MLGLSHALSPDAELAHVGVWRQSFTASATLFASSSESTGEIGKLKTSRCIFSVIGNDMPFHSE
jgi:hypothetical protein